MSRSAVVEDAITTGRVGRVVLGLFQVSDWYPLGNCLWWFEGACCIHSHRYDHVLVAFNGHGSPVGILVYRRQADGSLDFSRAVNPRSRRKGIAGILLKFFLEHEQGSEFTCTSIHPWMWPVLERYGFLHDNSHDSLGGRTFRRRLPERT